MAAALFYCGNEATVMLFLMRTSWRSTPLRRWCLVLVALAIGLARGSAASAQSWAFLDVLSETDLDFGLAPQGKGVIQRPRISADIAKFKIRGSLPAAGTGQRVVTLTFYRPTNLSGPASGLVPFAMSGAYNSIADDANSATTFSGTTVDIPLRILEGYTGGVGTFSAYVYVYGNVTVGMVPVGMYAADITVVAEPVAQTGGTGTEGCSVGWDPSVWYNNGDWVEYNGNGWRSLWWNAGNVPGSGGSTDPWEAMGPCGGPAEGTGCQAYAWSGTRVYNDGDWSTYNGKAWRALYYTRGETPGSLGANGAWEEMGPCDGSSWTGTGCAALTWTVSRKYQTGDQVTYNGKLWRALFYTRGGTPGMSNAWQLVQSCGITLANPLGSWGSADGLWFIPCQTPGRADHG
jgi:chitodextrinase